MNIQIKKEKIQEIKIEDQNYPEKLRHIYNPPKKLYVLGNSDLLNKKAIAIIGCRQYSEYGKKASTYFARELAKKDITIISGLAKGIDTYAHQGAISVPQGKTIAVLGCGLDTIYPAENKELYREILMNNRNNYNRISNRNKTTKTTFSCKK